MIMIIILDATRNNFPMAQMIQKEESTREHLVQAVRNEDIIFQYYRKSEEKESDKIREYKGI